MAFTNYHLHSVYSVLDGIIKIPDLVAWAKAHKCDSVGMTDHGSLSGVLTLYKECNKQGIKPLLGFEAYFTDDHIGEKNRVDDKIVLYHLVLIAKNRTGWDNLIKLHNQAYSEDMFYLKCRINLEMLRAHHEGIICTTACIASKPARKFSNGDIEGAKQSIQDLYDIFGEDLYLEMQEHGIAEEKPYNQFLYKVSQETGIPYVIQNDAHYSNKEDAFAHEVLLCKNTHNKITDEKRFKFPNDEFYLKGEAEIYDMFDYFPKHVVKTAIDNTQKLADKVENYSITYEHYNYPTFGHIDESYDKLKELTLAGFKTRFKDQDIDKDLYLKRISHELSAIKKIGFVDYFLILEDLMTWAKNNDIWTGYGRGSCGGSLVMYCLGITHVDPIKYNLLFSRFIDESRISAPDADLDVDDGDRDKVIAYLSHKYGKDRVGYISTFGEFKARVVFKAVASILELDFNIANTISAKMSPELSLKENFEQPELKVLLDKPKIKKIYDTALKLEGGINNSGLHACGQIISNKPFDEIIPCISCSDGKDGRITASSFEMKEVDGDLKMLKLDVLGLRNLGVLKEATKLIQERYNKTLDFKSFDFADNDTYIELSKGNSCGVFQFESQLMQRLLKSVKPKCLEDLAIVTSIGRPASLQSGLTESYLKRRNGEEPVEFLLPELEPLMQDTLGIYGIYQESLMQVCKYYAGFTDSEADQARKICGKKLKDKLPMLEKMFTEGAKKMGRDEGLTAQVFDNLKEFASYGFNKSHAIAYSAMSYATAYYKTHYPTEFLTALLNSVSDDLVKTGVYINEAMRLGIDILPPDINESSNKFTIDQEGRIRFGFNAIKGLGTSAINNIIAERTTDYKSIEDFIRRAKKVNKSALQSLLRVGAFNSICKNPKRWDNLVEYLADIKKNNVYPENIESAIYTRMAEKEYKKETRYTILVEQKRTLKTNRQDILRKQEINEQLEGIKLEVLTKLRSDFLAYENYTNGEMQEHELELLGFSITTHPYKRWGLYEKYFKCTTGKTNLEYIRLNDAYDIASTLEENKTVFHTVALISNIKKLITKRTKEEMAILTLEFFNTKISCTLFANDWVKVKNDIAICDMYSIVGRIEESYNYGKTQDVERYVLKPFSMRKLNVFNNKDNKFVVAYDDKTKDKIITTIKRVAYNERNNWKPINKAVFFVKDGKYIPFSGLAWINNTQEVINAM